eukprot:1208084-Amphidinium_carterae.1
MGAGLQSQRFALLDLRGRLAIGSATTCPDSPVSAKRSIHTKLRKKGTGSGFNFEISRSYCTCTSTT